jgi:hypothetical protein
LIVAAAAPTDLIVTAVSVCCRLIESINPNPSRLRQYRFVFRRGRAPTEIWLWKFGCRLESNAILSRRNYRMIHDVVSAGPTVVMSQLAAGEEEKNRLASLQSLIELHQFPLVHFRLFSRITAARLFLFIFPNSAVSGLVCFYLSLSTCVAIM